MEKFKKSNKIFKDLLENDFVNALQVNFSIQRVFGMLGVHLKYKFITPPTNLYKTYSLVIWLFNLICIMYTVVYCSSLFDPLSVDIPLKIGILINGVINTGLAWKSSFYSGHLKSQLYVKLQRIERILKMKNAKHLNRKIYMITMFWAIVAAIICIFWLTTFNKYLMKGFCPTGSVASVASTASFLMIFHVYIVLNIIIQRVEYVNDALVQVNGSKKEIVYFTANSGVASNVEIGKELVHGMCFILDSFADTMDVFQHAIFFFTFQMVAWQLITTQNLVVTFKKQMSVNIASFLCTLPSSMACMSLMLILCFTSQALTNRLEACQELCTSIISTHDEASMKETKVGDSPEYLSKDILDQDFVGIFKIIHMFQYFFGCCRVEAKDQFVTSPTRYQKAYTIFLLSIVLVLNVILLDLFDKEVHDAVIFHLSVFIIWYGFATCLCTVINARFFNGQENADFFVQMQKVDRLMGMDKVKGVNSLSKKVNSSSLYTLLSVFFVIFFLVCFNMKLLYILCLGSAYAQITVMVELIYCSNHIIYFVIRIRFINCIIKNHLSKDKNKTKKKVRNLLGNKNIKRMALATHNFATSDTHVYLKELFDLFTIFQNLYRFQLFIFCLKLVFGCLCAFGIILFSIQKNSADIMEIMTMVLFTIVDIFIAIFIGFRLQCFFSEVKETKRVCIAVMAEYSTGKLREKARKMLKMADETPPKLSIYDMYDMDAGIFLSIFSLITSLIVTLLQFAFL